MKKRLISILLCLAMLLSILPAAALAADESALPPAAQTASETAVAADIPPEKESREEMTIDGPSANTLPAPSAAVGDTAIYLGNVALQSGYYLATNSNSPKTSRPTSGGYAYWDGSTLTLHNYSYNGSGVWYTSSDTACIYKNGSFTVQLVGKNNLTNTRSEGFGMVCEDGSITVSGSGSLNISAPYGIRADYYDTADTYWPSTGNFNMTGGKVTVTSSSWGINCDTGFNMTGGNLTVVSNDTGLDLWEGDFSLNNGELTIVSNNDDAIYMEYGDFNLNNGVLNIVSHSGDGIYMQAGDMTLRNGSGNINAYNTGIDTQNLTIDNFAVRLFGHKFGAVRCYKGNLNIVSPMKILYPLGAYIDSYQDSNDVRNIVIRTADGYTSSEAAIGHPFQDVAKSSYYNKAVYWALGTGITNGTTATTFSPNKACTRAEAVTFIWRMCGQPESSATSCPFNDVKKSAFYYDAMMWAVENDITNGLSATKFGPNEPCTRGQIVTFLWRTMGEARPAAGSCPFTDVSTRGFYYDAMMWAIESGITDGTSSTTFSPNAPCTRAQIVTFMYRLIED